MKTLKFKHINERTSALMPLKKHFKGVKSWCKYIRTGLGMTLEQLGHRASLSTPTISQIERNEALDKITLASLKKVAEAMNCELVYAFVPNEKLEVMRDKQAERKAKQFVKESHLHMEYEDQAVTKKQLKSQWLELKEKLKTSHRLWD